MTGTMAELSERGDTKVMWDSENAEEVANARAQFDRLVGKGFVAYKVNPEGRQSERMRTFDSAAEKVILVPQMQGG